MTHFLSLKIYADTPEFLEAVALELPAVEDSRVSDLVNEHDYSCSSVIPLDGDIYMIAGQMHFKSDAGREDIFNSIQGVQEIFSGCLPGSEILLVASYSHDGTEERPCEIIARYKVVP